MTNPVDQIDQYIKTARYVACRRLLMEAPSVQSEDADVVKETNHKFEMLQTAMLQIQYDYSPVLGLDDPTVLSFYQQNLETNHVLEEIILTCAFEFRARTGLHGQAWQTFCTQLAETIHVDGPTKGRKDKCHVPKEIIERIISIEEKQEILIHNPWLVFCIILSFADPAVVPKADIDKRLARRGGA